MKNEEVSTLISSCMRVIQEISDLNKEAAQTVKQLSYATNEQTKTFIMQIEKLSKRLDEAQADRQNLIQLNSDQSRQIDKLLELLHDSITKSTNFIQQQ